jgi:hypothetical protein
MTDTSKPQEDDISVLFQACATFEQDRPLSDGAKRRVEMPLSNDRELDVFEAVRENRDSVRSALAPLSGVYSWQSPDRS